MRENSLRDIRRMLDSKVISAEELTAEYLNKIKQLNKEINAFISVDGDAATKRSRRLDSAMASGENVGVLGGIPFALKDNLCTRGIATTCGSGMLENFVPPYSATCAERLERAGGILLGKTNMDEFGMGSDTDTSVFGRTLNPLDMSRTAGGSSGGSAAAVASGMAAFALGSDTGGSVRLPAAFCGCVGLKPTYGAVSRYGLVAYASSLDTVGVLSGCVDDSELVFSVIRGRDAHDATSSDGCDCRFADGKLLRVGICRETVESADTAVSECIYAAAEALRARGAEVIDISLPRGDEAVACYYVLCCSEASSNLGRYDGIRYGHRTEIAGGIEELFINSRTEGFGDEVKHRIMLGTYCLHGAGRMDYYAKAQSAKEKIKAQMAEALRECDVILMPTARGIAPKISEERSHLSVWRDDAFCLIASLCGLPAITLPFGTHEGMPLGVQLVAGAFDEEVLFRTGKMLEEARA